MIRIIDILREILEKKKARSKFGIAIKKYDTTSSYRSQAIVRSNGGEIYKNLKEETSSITQAKEKIDQLPKGKIFDDAKNIESIFKKSKYDWSKVIETYEKNKTKSRFTTVNINDINITQSNIQANKVKSMLDKVDSLPSINVVEFEDGEKVIYDAHHRLVANWALGNDSIEVNLIKIK